jgi:hypothetical protein
MSGSASEISQDGVFGITFSCANVPSSVAIDAIAKMT